MVDMTFLYTTVVTAAHIFTFMFFDDCSSHVHVCNALPSRDGPNKQELLFISIIICNVFNVSFYVLG